MKLPIRVGLIITASVIVVSCSSSSSSDNSSAGGGPDGGASSSGASSSSSSSSGGGNNNTDGGTTPQDPNQVPVPVATCPPIALSDITHADVTLGASGQPPCTEAGLQTALDHGGVITFQCGGTTAAPFVLTLAAERTVDKQVVLDGEGKVTLSGDKKTRILHIGHGDFEAKTPLIIVQRLNFVDGHTDDVANTSSTDHGGAAIYRVGAELTVIDSKFLNNIGPTNGQDVAGGAIYSIGGGSTKISGSAFSGNTCSNGGALGNLGVAALTIVNTSFDSNAATGQNANPGNGGNGGAISFDGPASSGCNNNQPVAPFTPITVTMCGASFSKNHGGSKALGGAFFRTVDTTCVPKNTAPVTIDRTTFDANEADAAGAMYIHQVDLTLTNSTLSNNITHAGSAGALWAEGSDGAEVTLNLTNVTVSGNTVTDGLGGGFSLASHIGGGEFLHVTVANNAVKTTSGNQYAVFGGGLVGDATKVKLTNSIFANNQKPAAVSGDSSNCESLFVDGGGNIEFIADHPDPKRCAAGSSLVDPKLAALADNGGPTQTISLAVGSPAIGDGKASCTPQDQRGKPRTSPCASGAFEPP